MSAFAPISAAVRRSASNSEARPLLRSSLDCHHELVAHLGTFACNGRGVAGCAARADDRPLVLSGRCHNQNGRWGWL